MNKTVSLEITTEINQKIETAVENRHYRSKSDLMRVGIEKVLYELELKEQTKDHAQAASNAQKVN